MSLTLDHLVIAVADLDAAFADYSRLGFTVTPGLRGLHVGVDVARQERVVEEALAGAVVDVGPATTPVSASR
jgi:catechol 2,3-dioxygenase-like lactoylglutathione lyase family enzyme